MQSPTFPTRLANRLWAQRYTPDRLSDLVRARAFAEREVLAFREDGFGMRMGEILNAWRIAQGFGARFVFMWPARDIDGIRPAELVFSSAFRQSHLVEERDLDAYRQVGTWRPSDVRALHRGSVRGVWSISKRSHSHKKKFVLGTDGIELPALMSMREAFDAIDFVPDLAEIRARSQAQPEIDVAVHVRRGDIVAEGSSGSLDAAQTHKAIPLALIDRLVESSVTQGRRVAVFGNGAAPLGLRERYAEVLTADDVVVVDQARTDLVDFRDFCLLTRVREVIAAGSAFAMVPTLIGNGSRITVDDCFDLETQHALILRQLQQEKLPPSEVIVAVAHLLRREDRYLDSTKPLEVLEAAVAAEHDNPLLRIGYAARLMPEADRAEEALRRSMPGPPALRLIRSARPSEGASPQLAAVGGPLVQNHHWTALEESETTGPWMDFVIGLRWLARGLRDSAIERLSRAEIGDEDPVAHSAIAELTLG